MATRDLIIFFKSGPPSETVDTGLKGLQGFRPNTLKIPTAFKTVVSEQNRDLVASNWFLKLSARITSRG